MKLKVRLKNGAEVEARTEEWLAAILGALTPEQQNKVFGAVQAKLVAYETPGSHILQAEPMKMNFRG